MVPLTALFITFKGLSNLIPTLCYVNIAIFVFFIMAYEMYRYATEKNGIFIKNSMKIQHELIPEFCEYGGLWQALYLYIWVCGRVWYIAVFLRTVITESDRVKSLVSAMEIVLKVARLSNIHAPEIEIFQSAKVAILSRNYGP